MLARSLSVIALSIALLAGCAPARAQESEPDFTRRIADRFRVALAGRTVEISGELQLRIADKPEPFEVNVGRIFNFCQTSTTTECEDSIERFVTAIAEGVANLDAPVTRAQLRVAVRNHEFCDYIDSDPKFRERDGGPIKRPFVAGTCTLIMADFPNRARSVTETDLRDLGLQTAAAWALAETQTLVDLPGPETLQGLGEGVVAVSGFDYAPTIMLNAEGWRKPAAAGEILVAIPASDVAIVARRAKVPDLATFKAAARQHFTEAERGVSPLVYRWTGSGWAEVE